MLISLECAGSHQRNGTSPVCIRFMFFEIQLFFLRLWGLSSRKHGARVSDQLSDRLIFGRLFQANKKFSTFRSCANL